ncbi:MAG TPA: RNA polymerase sigma factor [Candidatus Acidoferrum sp.]|nr:RNA polymerase sigma factor [Candidatus Acidoferrum sp.]
MVAHDEEQDWIARSRKGDHEAFEALVRRYQRMIHALAFRMTGSSSDAEDVAQETFIAAFHELDGFKGDARFSSWLYRIATNRCLNWIKRIERRAHAYESWVNENKDASIGNDDEVIAHAVQGALMKLDPQQRSALVLTAYENLSHAEAAMILGCAETTVSWRVFTARRKLKRWLTPLVKGGRVD